MQTLTDATVRYLIVALQDDNQAESLANYLRRHGREAVNVSNEVTIPCADLDVARSVFELEAHWKMFWRYSEEELYGMPAYYKPACEDHTV